MKHLFYLVISLWVCTTYAQTQTGKASFYADKFEGRTTASGEVYQHILPTAAHRTLPFGTMVKVTNLANNRYAVVRVNDRGPFVAGRIIDVSLSVAEKLGFVGAGVANVKIEVVAAGDYGNDNSAGNDGNNTDPEEEVVTTTTTTTTTIGGNTEVDPMEYYELDVEKVTPNWLGVQVGSFQELANLIRMANELKENYNKDIVVRVKVVNGIKVYALILGKFSSRNRAESFQRRAQKEYPDCFVVDMTQG